METNYYPDDNILMLKLSAKPIVKEVSQNGYVNISYDEEEKIVEVAILDVKESGMYPVLEAT